MSTLQQAHRRAELRGALRHRNVERTTQLAEELRVAVQVDAEVQQRAENLHEETETPV